MTADQSREASALLKNGLLWEIIGEQLTRHISAWRASEATEQRESLWHQVRALEVLRERIENECRRLCREAGPES
jgi:hypothetical protein